MTDLKQQGININRTPNQIGDSCTISYEGLLKKSGADQVFIHCGYGPAWSQVQDMPMYNTETGCTCDVNISQDGLFNFCFKDSADHWDNNDGQNWTFAISQKPFLYESDVIVNSLTFEQK